ncbi:Protein GST-14, partial [Aphelenchoides avenae]
DKLQKEKFEPAVEKYLPVLNEKLAQSKSGFLVSSGVTWADFFVADRLYTIGLMVTGCLQPYPALSKYIKKVYDLPQLHRYIMNRPQSRF